MTPFEQATVPPEEVARVFDGLLKQFDDHEPGLMTTFGHLSREEFSKQARLIVHDESSQLVFLNDTYQVNVRRMRLPEMGDILHLSIKRIDKQPVHDWRDLQRIKNEIVGPECEAVELYPAESRLVDSANQYHLWCVPDDTFRWPFGFTQRMVTETPGNRCRPTKVCRMSAVAQLDSATRADPDAGFLLHAREALRGVITKAKPRSIDREFTLTKPLAHGWLLPFLLATDNYCWGRWTHWAEVMTAGELAPDGRIPRIEWVCAGANGYAVARKMWERSLDSIPRYGSWQGWSSWLNVDYLFDWLLFGLGHAGNKSLPAEPSGCEGACARLYQTFSIETAVAFPYDHFGDLLAENHHGRHLGFYPTPLHVSEMMAAMLFGDGDGRNETTCDPCLGTGRMLLAASNHSYRLYGQDINPTVIKASLINGYLYAPWLVRPFPFLDRPLTNPNASAAISDWIGEQTTARPDVAIYLADTEHDADTQPFVEPIKIRRKRSRVRVDENTMLLPLGE